MRWAQIIHLLIRVWCKNAFCTKCATSWLPGFIMTTWTKKLSWSSEEELHYNTLLLSIHFLFLTIFSLECPISWPLLYKDWIWQIFQGLCIAIYFFGVGFIMGNGLIAKRWKYLDLHLLFRALLLTFAWHTTPHFICSVILHNKSTDESGLLFFIIWRQYNSTLLCPVIKLDTKA